MQAQDIPRETAASITERLSLARAEAVARGRHDMLLAFDADGTLWGGDVGLDMFTALLASRRISSLSLDALRAEAASVPVEAAGDAMDVAIALFDAFESGRYHEARAFAMMAWAFAGFTEDELRAFTARVLADAGLAARLHREIDPVLAWARGEGVDVYVVSASPRAAVEAGARELGIPADRVLAMTPDVAGGVLQPRLAGPVVYGEGKLEALRARRPGALLLGGFGDSSYDAAFLREARVKVAVRPKESLFRVAHEIPGLVSIEG